MLETLKQQILEVKDSRISFEERYVQNMMEVQDENLEAEFASLTRLNANLDVIKLDRLIAKTAEELRYIDA